MAVKSSDRYAARLHMTQMRIAHGMTHPLAIAAERECMRLDGIGDDNHGDQSLRNFWD